MPSPTAEFVWLLAPDAPCIQQDRERACSLGIAVVEQQPREGFVIARDERGLALFHAEESAAYPGLRCALDAADAGGRLAMGRRSPLARALGLHRHPPMGVLDCTCGLGRDAMTLASLGCDVTMIERNPALYALLMDATDRIGRQPQPPPWWSRWNPPIHADARTWLVNDENRDDFDVIYIDPMFDSPRRKSRPQKALVRLGELVGRDKDASELVATARRHAKTRVVVKQHARATPFGAPDLQVRGRAVRFDVYLTAR